MNPLLNMTGLADFAAIRAEHVAPAMNTLLTDAGLALEQTVSDAVPADYDTMSALLDVALERLGRAWGAVGHLNAVVDTSELRAAYNAALPKVTEFFTRLGADERLHAKYRAIDAAALTAPRQRALSNALRDFRLSGAELQGAAKERYAQIQERLAELSQSYSEHVLDATDGFAYVATAAELDGVPDDVKQAARDAAQAEGQAGYKLTLHYPCYGPVMQYAVDRKLRQTLYRAYVTRASELGPPERDNSDAMRELLALRQEEARLLGHANYAEVSLVPKMADSPAQVAGFLRDLAQRARPHAERDLAELRAYAAEHLGLPELQAWDLAYASEQLKQSRYAFSDQEVKQYFTEAKVLSGLFEIVQRVFDVKIKPDDASIWQRDVRFYRVERSRPGAEGGAAELLAQFYLDPYARTGKRPGAWMDDVRSRWLRPGGELQTPVATLVCNFAPSVGDQPALLTHDDLITLFHEFGHGLHLMLTRIDDLAVSGLSGVEWDAVELPSQFMENFCWEHDVLQRLSAHVETGAALPRALFDKMLAAKNFQSGLQTLRQVEMALFDLRIHAEPPAADRIQAVLDEVRGEVTVVEQPAFNRFQHGFSHIFAGGYAAGYYSYKWAEVLSADAWSAFEEGGVLNPDIGSRLAREILEVGGSRPAIASFKAFRGREPRIDALLRHQGMA